MSLSDNIVSTAASFDGACACAPFRQRIFDAVGMPFDPRPFAVINGKVQGVSTCYIFARHVLDLCGVKLPTWHIGEPIGTIIAWAKKNDLWQAMDSSLCPNMGDILVIGPNGGTHVCVVESCDGEALRTIDGGQVCRQTGPGHDGTGRQMISRRERQWLGDSVVGSRVDPVVGWVDVTRL